MRKFVDTIDSVFPHLGGDDGPRRKIIDSAFKMTEQLVKNFLDVTGKALTESGRKSAEKTPAKKAPGRPDHCQAGTGSQSRSTEDRCKEVDGQASTRQEDHGHTCVGSQGPGAQGCGTPTLGPRAVSKVARHCGVLGDRRARHRRHLPVIVLIVTD